MTQAGSVNRAWRGREAGGLAGGAGAARLAGAVVVGLILLLAALAKVTHPDVGVLAVDGLWAAIPTASFGAKSGIDWLIAGAELLVAAAVLVFHRRRLTWIGVALLFGAFGGYAAQKLFAGLPCGCFGGWGIKPQFSLALDVVGVALGLGFASAQTVRGNDIFAYLATAVVWFAAMGAGVAAMTRPPTAEEIATREGMSAVQRLMLLPEMADIRTAGASDPAWMVYIYNPDCQTCQLHLRTSFGPYEESHGDDDVLRVRTVQMDLLEDLNGIELWAWGENVPTTILVQGGVVTQQWGAKDIPDPQATRLMLSDKSASGQGDGILKLMRLPMMADVMGAEPDDPHWLVYVYNPDCPKCMEHLVKLRQFMEQTADDPTLRVRIFSMPDLVIDHGIEMYDWATVPTTALFHQGMMKRLYPVNEVPDPFELWMELSE